jgi:plasmid stabilization system protein ParE
MTFAVVVSEQAAEEMERAATWWAEKRSVEQAERWYAGMRAAIADLRIEPQRLPFAAENGDFPYELRELHYGLGARPTHRAIFTIVKQTVVVMAVRHAAQDRLRSDDIR